MRQTLLILSLALVTTSVLAQDRAKFDFSHQSEYRARFFFWQNPGADGGSANLIDHRFKASGLYRANEKLAARVTLLHNATFGQSSKASLADAQLSEHDTATGSREENFISVNEAFGSWLITEEITLKFGRQNFTMSDGFVIDANDWERTPFSFEGALVNYEIELGRIQTFGFRLRDQESLEPQNLGHPKSNSSASADPEHNLFGVNFELKTRPLFVKQFNVHLMKNVNDAILDRDGSTIRGFQGQNILRFGGHAHLNYRNVDLKLWHASSQGINSRIDETGVRQKADAKGHLFQGEIAYNFSKFRNSRIFALYHLDSGDRDDSADNGVDEGYDPLFFSRHYNAGLMDLFRWGNLTYVMAGVSGQTTANSTLGLSYLRFYRTVKGLNSQRVSLGTFGGGLVSDSGSDAGDLTKDHLGDEIDLSFDYRFESGLHINSRVGYFVPGEYFDNSTTDQGANIVQVMIEGRVQFQ